MAFRYRPCRRATRRKREAMARTFRNAAHRVMAHGDACLR